MRHFFRIYADTHDITAAVQDRLQELKISDEAGIKSDTLTLTFDDRRTADGVVALPRIGTRLAVALGYRETALTDMGSYLVDEIEMSHPPALLRVGAKAADMAGPFRSPRTRSWDDVTLGGIVLAIAQEHGYEPSVDETLAAVAIPHLDQVAESDMALLTRLAEGYDAVAKPMGGKLVLARAGEAKSVSGRELPLLSMAPDDITSWRFRHSARAQGGSGKETDGEKPGGYRARWWDYWNSKAQTVEVGSPPYEEIRYQYGSEAEARAAAASKMNKGKRKEGGLSLTLPGDPRYAAECRLRVSLRPGIPTDWRIVKVDHTLSGGGYVCSIEAEKFMPGQHHVTKE